MKNNIALSVYNQAADRFTAGKATKAEEVMLALWDEVIEQAATIRAMRLKLSFLESAEIAPTGDNASPAEVACAALLQRCAKRAN